MKAHYFGKCDDELFEQLEIKFNDQLIYNEENITDQKKDNYEFTFIKDR
ncbi:MAG: hypothetical protein ACERKD_02070 [Prolixibacteraceae bacterium]